jgi:hypothetical protein
LIENNVTGLALESARNAKWIWIPAAGQRCNDVCANVNIQFIRRNHQARASLPYLAPPCRVELDEDYIASP